MTTTDSRALVVAREATGIAPGVLALAAISESDFTAYREGLALALKRVEELKHSIMEPEVDYGVIPGTDKPTLLQPGAQKIASVMRLVPTFDIKRSVGEQTPPLIHYLVTCSLSMPDGTLVAQGVGSANSHERKHRYRLAQTKCPTCGATAIIKGRAEFGGGWLCFHKKGGCGAKFPDGDASIEKQERGQIENADPLDLDNTLLKMGKKRAFVDAVLTASMSSGLFTQDMEDAAGDLDAVANEREAALARIGELLKANGVKKNADLIATVERLTRKKLSHAKELGSWSVTDLRALAAKLRDFFGEDVTPAVEDNAGDEKESTSGLAPGVLPLS